MAKKRAPKYVDPFEDPSSIGNVLMRLGKLNLEQLQKAVGQKAQFDEHLLGALLKSLGFVGDSDVALALKIQAEMRAGRAAHASLDVLDSKLAESSACAHDLVGAISDAREKRKRRVESSRTPFFSGFDKATA